MTADDLLARLLYRDAFMLVIDKPAGLPVHAGPKGGDHLEKHLAALRFGLPHDPALAHRLDKDTSGCLVLGRHRKATARLGELFASGAVRKTYWAIVAGGPPADEGLCAAPLARRSHDRRSWWMKVDESGLPSLTHWRVLGKGAGVSFLELNPETGRTHQLRVHMSHLGCPIVGDGVYGGGPARGIDRRLHLHARAIEVPLYAKKAPINIEAPVPTHMMALIATCGGAR
jgi:RluA family pseudouridine synthase